MATQICPNCKQDSFTWSIDEDESTLTLPWFHGRGGSLSSACCGFPYAEYF